VTTGPIPGLAARVITLLSGLNAGSSACPERDSNPHAPKDRGF
jgi:hypothetical protein